MMLEKREWDFIERKKDSEVKGPHHEACLQDIIFLVGAASFHISKFMGYVAMIVCLHLCMRLCGSVYAIMCVQVTLTDREEICY